jgi:DNA-binding CsgD family transcriptional regulator/PAS domain-containing protein
VKPSRDFAVAMDMRDRVLGLIQQLYAAPASELGWTSFLESLCVATDGYCAQFISLDQRGHAGLTLAVRADPAAKDAYDQHWGAFDPWGRRLRQRRAAPGAVILGDEMVPHSELQRTAFYADFGRRYDLVRCIAGTIEVAPEILSVITIGRTEGHRPFGTEESALLSALMPHLQRALQLHRRIATAEAVSNDLAGVVESTTRAVLLVNAAGKVTWMNGSAERLTAARDGLSVEAHELRAARGADTTRLRALLAAAAATSAGQGTSAGGAIALGRPTGRRPLMALVAPLPPRPAFFSRIATAVAMVVVTDPERVVISGDETLRMLFGLTAGEAALTRLLAQGDTVTEAAARLGLRVDTIRTRLKTIFEKTGTHRQADLVRVVLVASTQI